jgi:spore coat protein U-like protein
MRKQLGMLRKIATILIFLCGAFWLPSSAYAQSCTMTVSNLNFGSVDVLSGTAVNVTGSIDFNCNGFHKNQSNRFCIDIGSGADFSGSQRQLNGPGTAVLNYDLYKDAARTQTWGSWQTGFQTAGLQIDLMSDNSGDLVASVPLYAKLFANQQTAAAGAYTTSFPASSSGAYARFDKNGSGNCPTGGNNANDGFTVSATVLSTCNVSATTVGFGTVGSLGSNVDSTGTVSAQCSNTLPYSVSLNGGTSGATDPTQRKMAQGANLVTYGLYRDSARSLPWGSTIGTNTVAGTGSGASQNITVYGRVPPQATGPVGTYNDTIVVTVTY